MAEQDPTKRGQVTGMNPHQTTETSQDSPPLGSGPRDSLSLGSDTLSGVGSTAGAVLEADLQAHIGRQLRAVYEEVVNEAVPDRFLKLLEDLERERDTRS